MNDDIQKIADAIDGGIYLEDIVLSQAERIDVLEEALRFLLGYDEGGIILDHPSAFDKRVIVFIDEETESIHVADWDNPFTAIAELRPPYKR